MFIRQVFCVKSNLTIKGKNCTLFVRLDIFEAQHMTGEGAGT